MPTKPGSPCRYPGCPHLAYKRGYCEKHLPSRYREETERRTPQVGYGRRWNQTSKRFLIEHPLCVECEREGRVTAAEVTDHIIPHKGNMTLFWDSNNWQPLCKFHHDQKTVEEGAFGK